MPRAKDPNKRNYTIVTTHKDTTGNLYAEEEVKHSENLQSQRDASRRYDATQDKIILRVPEGYREKIQDHVKKLDEQEETKGKYLVKGRHSVNAFILDLIQRELERSES